MTKRTPLRALVTAGGTREPIDDVRVVTNLSSGRFGIALATALADAGASTTILGGASVLARRSSIDRRITIVGFESAADLDARIEEILASQGAPDLLLMAAAVSDYTTDARAGKISSTADELVVRLVRAPKILPTLRERCGARTFLVGFKLLSGVPRAALVDAALRQIDGGGLDLTVANDAARLREGDPREHPVVLVAPDGSTLDVEGRREAVAERIAETCIGRRSSSRIAGSRGGTAGSDEREAGVAGVAGIGMVGPRGGLAHEVARTLPGVDVALRCDRGLVLHPESGFRLDSLPVAGSEAERVDVHRTLAAEAAAGRYAGGAFAIDLGGPAIVGWPEGDADEVARRWAEHAPSHVAEGVRPSPILDGPALVGIRYDREPDRGGERDGEPWTSLRILPGHEGRGIADRVLERLEADDRRVAAPVGSGLDGYVRMRAWREIERKTLRGPDGEIDLAILEPPGRRDDLGAAASICLVDAIGRRVLVGRRLTEPWLGYHALPGGKVDGDETEHAAAIRELQEETGIELDPHAAPVATHVVRVAQGERAFRIACHVHFVLECPEAIASAEIEAVWLPIEEALARRPMAAGTRRILRRVAALLGDPGAPHPSPDP